MGRLVIISECVYSNIALQQFFVYEQKHLMKSTHEYEKLGVVENDFLIINLDERSFKSCYWFLRKQKSDFLKRNVILLSNKINVYIMQALLDEEFQYIYKKTDVASVDRIVLSRINGELDEFISVEFELNMTRMERLILLMILSNVDQKTTAKILKMSFKTVSTHKCNIIRKIREVSNKSFSNNRFFKYMIN